MPGENLTASEWQTKVLSELKNLSSDAGLKRGILTQAFNRQLKTGRYKAYKPSSSLPLPSFEITEMSYNWTRKNANSSILTVQVRSRSINSDRRPRPVYVRAPFSKPFRELPSGRQYIIGSPTGSLQRRHTGMKTSDSEIELDPDFEHVNVKMEDSNLDAGWLHAVPFGEPTGNGGPADLSHYHHSSEETSVKVDPDAVAVKVEESEFDESKVHIEADSVQPTHEPQVPESARLDLKRCRRSDQIAASPIDGQSTPFCSDRNTSNTANDRLIQSAVKWLSDYCKEDHCSRFTKELGHHSGKLSPSYPQIYESMCHEHFDHDTLRTMSVSLLPLKASRSTGDVYLRFRSEGRNADNQIVASFESSVPLETD